MPKIARDSRERERERERVKHSKTVDVNASIVSQSLKNEKLPINKRKRKNIFISLCATIPLLVVGLAMGLVFGLKTDVSNQGGTGGGEEPVMSYYSIEVETPTNGTIETTCENLTNIERGTNVSFTITPEEGYYIESITIDGQPITVTGLNGDGQVYEFTNVTSDRTISATFAVKSSEYSVTNGGEASYTGLNTVTAIVIPEKVNGVSVSSFDTTTIPTMTNLEEITVDEDNSAYSSSDGALYNKALDTLVVVPVAKDTIIFPSTLTIIGEKAFENSTLLEVILPSTIETVNANAFKNSSIETLSVSSGSTTLSADALANMTNLTEIVVTNDLSNSYALPDANDNTYTYSWFLDGVTKTSILDSGTYSVLATGYSTPPNASDGWTYYLELGKYYLLHVPTGGNGPLLIPSRLRTTSGVINIYGLGLNQYPIASANYSSIVIEDGITSITNNAFQHCTGLTSITIPSSVTTIGDSAFYGCTGLTSITIPSSVTNIGSVAFYYCPGLTSIMVDPTNTNYSSIDGVLFNKNQTTLICYPAGKTATTYIFPFSVTNIGGVAFYACTNLTSITIPSSVTIIDATPGSQSGDFPGAFACCSNLTSITFAEGSQLITIGAYAFSHCSNLTSITIPSSVTSIGDSAFYYCSGLTSITIEGNITTLGSNVFNYCPNLKTLNIGVTVASLPINNLFASGNLSGIKIINVGSTNTAYEVKTDTNGYGLYLKGTTELVKLLDGTIILNNGVIYQISGAIGNYTASVIGCDLSSSTNLTISSTVSYKDETVNVTSIGSRAFEDCTGLTSITIPSSVTNIGQSAFDGCTSLTSITVDPANTNYSSIDGVLFNKNQTTLICYPIGKTATAYTVPYGVGSIGVNAFYRCSNLTSITMPEGVTSIGNSTFKNCIGLTSIIIPASITGIAYSAFHKCQDLASVTIDSSTIAGLSSSSSNLLTYATTVYVKDTINTVGTYITNSFYTTESDRTGYVKYIKNS